MEVTFSEIEGVLRTLPVSYYTKRSGIHVELNPNEDATYFSPYEDRISISAKMVQHALIRVTDKSLFETTVRTLLYHEISHAILTPKTLLQKSDRLKSEVFNIFEDERIETMLQDYYYDVDFKRNIYIINNYVGAEPHDAISAFYNIVRFRHPDDKRTNAIIEEYSYITANHEYSDCEYKETIWEFFLDVAKEWLEKEKKDSLLKIDPNYDLSSEPKKKYTVERVIRGEMKDPYGSFTPTILSGGLSKKELEKLGGKMIEGELPEGVSPEMIDAMIDEAKEASSSKHFQKDIPIQKMLDSTLNKFYDPELISKLSLIFEKFIKRGNRYKGLYHCNSGVIDPSAFGVKALKDSWKVFSREANDGGVKGKKKLHINLFIDTSGSYRCNEDKTNSLLKSMIELEKRYRFFSFDLVTCQVGETLRTKSERYIQANGGNSLDDKIFEIFKKLQDPAAFNYNIVLFDGDAFCNSYYPKGGYKKNFGAFNVTNCCIISDRDNEAAIKQYAKKAHITIVRGIGSKAYSELLTDQVLHELSLALS